MSMPCGPDGDHKAKGGILEQLVRGLSGGSEATSAESHCSVRNRVV